MQTLHPQLRQLHLRIFVNQSQAKLIKLSIDCVLDAAKTLELARINVLVIIAHKTVNFSFIFFNIFINPPNYKRDNSSIGCK